MNSISDIVTKQREFYLTGRTRDVGFRVEQLKLLKQNIIKYESRIIEALNTDLHKSQFEAFTTEIGMVLSELTFMINHVKKYARPTKVKTPIHQFPAKSIIYHEPFGTVLIMSPWNYPVNLTLTPLVGAIAGGNTAVIKPSAYSPSVSSVIADLIKDTFEPEYVTVVQGGRAENQDLLKQHFDLIFFTGSPAVGKEVMAAAAANLTPVVLELGGKSPAIIDDLADMDLAAKRLMWGKTVNAGQTCVAPDYVFVSRRNAEVFLKKCIEQLHVLYPSQNGGEPDYSGMTHIINDKHYKRLENLLKHSPIYYGGECDASQRMIKPTIVYPAAESDEIMQSEIFGPILPVMVYDDMNEVIEFVSRRPRPLALYLFAEDKDVINRIMNNVPFGGGCVNDTIVHLASDTLPFGGIGNSGMGRYHGKASFDCFTCDKSVLNKSTKMDLPMRYPPYTEKSLNLVKKFLK